MIGYYHIPSKKGIISQHEQLHIADDSELKDALHNKSIEKVKHLSFKNANINDKSLRLLNQCQTSEITNLDLSQNFGFITDATIQVAVELTCLKQLRSLNLADNQISDDSLVLLSKSSNFMHLEQLILYGNSDITGAGPLLLAESPFLKHIKHLDLHATSVDDEGMELFFASENSQSLQTLNLNMSWKSISDKTLYSLANSKYCKNIKTLLLQDCKVTDRGIDELSESENSSCLTHLNLNNSIKKQNNIITDKSLTSLGLSKFLVHLKCLQLRNTEITAKGVRTLSVSLAAESIETFRLSHCKNIDSQVLNYIEKIASYQSLKKVYLNQCKIDQEELKAFENKNNKLNLIF